MGADTGGQSPSMSVACGPTLTHTFVRLSACQLKAIVAFEILLCGYLPCECLKSQHKLLVHIMLILLGNAHALAVRG